MIARRHLQRTVERARIANIKHSARSLPLHEPRHRVVVDQRADVVRAHLRRALVASPRGPREFQVDLHVSARVLVLSAVSLGVSDRGMGFLLGRGG